MQNRTVLVTVAGRVQGVGFRAWTEEQAVALKLTGWVRNEPDGSVAALISGPEDKVATMLDRLRHGPPLARVLRLDTRSMLSGEAPAGFRQIR